MNSINQEIVFLSTPRPGATTVGAHAAVGGKPAAVSVALISLLVWTEAVAFEQIESDS